MCFRLSNFKKLFALLAVGPKYVCPLKPDRRYLKKKKKENVGGILTKAVVKSFLEQKFQKHTLLFLVCGHESF